MYMYYITVPIYQTNGALQLISGIKIQMTYRSAL